MKTMTKWLAATVILTTLFSPAGASATTYPDKATYSDLHLAGEWARDSILEAGRAGIMLGTPEGTFRPTATITRREVAISLAKALGLGTKLPTKIDASPFSDMSVDAWGLPYIIAMKNAGLMSGDPNGTFRPNDLITKEEISVILAKGLLGTYPTDKLAVQDESVISAWALEAMTKVHRAGLLPNVGKFIEPKANPQRQDVAYMTVKLIQRNAVESIIETKRKAVASKDVKAFLSVLDPNQPELRAEQEHWFNDLIANDIHNYKLRIKSITAVNPDTLTADIEQTYTFKGQEHSLHFTERFVFTENGWKDADILFNTISTDHFEIRYQSSAKGTAVAKEVAADAETAYQNLMSKLPYDLDGKTVIKIYDDAEQLRQSVKLSYGWTFAGWYEYPESIKMTSEHGTDLPYESLVGHELTHKATISWTKNNLPYWLAEGLAVHYASPMPLFAKEDYTYKSIAALEGVNPEALTDPKDVTAYYSNTAAIVSFLIETYGADKMKAVLNGLGKHPFAPGTVIDNDKQSQQRLNELLPAVFGKTVEQLDSEWLKWVAAKQATDALPAGTLK